MKDNINISKKPEEIEDYIRQGELDKAIATGENLLQEYNIELQLVQKHLAKAYKKQGKICQKQQKLEDAKTIYKQAISKLPMCWFAYRNLCDILVKQKKWKELTTTSLTIVKLKKDIDWAYPYLMTAYQELGDSKKYLVAWQQLCAIKGWKTCPINNYQFEKEILGVSHLDALVFIMHNLQLTENLKALEINSQDGIVTCYLLDNLLTKNTDTITCIAENFNNHFTTNIQKSNVSHKVTQLAGNYSETINSLPVYTYDIIYFYSENTSINNLTQVSKLLTPNGIIILKKWENINLEEFEVIYNKHIIIIKNKSNLGEAEEISCIKKTVEQSPTAKNYLELGKSLKKYDYLEEALDCYLNALKIDPYFLETFFDLRFNFLRYKLTENLRPIILQKVINFCQYLLKENPEHLWLYLILGYALTKTGKIDTAIEYYQQASNKETKKLKPYISPSSWLTATTQKPHFIVIGAEKCGTTSLYWYLRQHPKIFTSVEKEIDFFDREFDKGLDWYLSHFAQVPQDDYYCVGEVSPNYIYNPHAPQRIYDILPDTKLIVILRNPIERAISRYFMIAKHTKKLAAVTEELKSEVDKIKADYKGDNIGWHRRGGNVGNSLYVYHLKSWLEIFPREQFLILKSEDFYANPASTMKQIFDYLQLPDYQLDKYPKHNSGNYTPIEPDLRATLAEFFVVHNQRLEELLGIKFNWT